MGDARRAVDLVDPADVHLVGAQGVERDGGEGVAPTAPTIVVRAPARAAATAWLAPLPPRTDVKRVPKTVSPGRGSGEAAAVRSTLMLPTTTTAPEPVDARPAADPVVTMGRL